MFRFGPYSLYDRLGSSAPAPRAHFLVQYLLFYITKCWLKRSVTQELGATVVVQKTEQQSLVICDDLIHWVPNAPIILLLLLLSLNGTNDRICVMEGLGREQDIDNNSYEITITAITVFSSLNY